VLVLRVLVLRLRSAFVSAGEAVEAELHPIFVSEEQVDANAMPINRRQFVAACGTSLAAARSQTSPGRKPYGSGHFGEWIEDEFGLPAFRYTCDQLHDPKAVTPGGRGFYRRPIMYTRWATTG
jgi:hypothetical protein